MVDAKLGHFKTGQKCFYYENSLALSAYVNVHSIKPVWFYIGSAIDFYWVSRQSAKSTSSGQNITKVSKQTKIANWNDSNWPKRQFTGKKMVVTKSIA